ncbi:DUF3658 domain-containing protein [Azotobacter beijerinckii]|uniref:DUF1835 domain-containing protein n=1 Tax=Azotobacter beijerinckii TaxID=170623 RepID=A0A1I4CDX7_9GAMM|nr:DUF3658 domain-containing protein [Azotobacter beijerinckii]SFB22662.1 protein of unknown function [Azotobacter beijerinckii]SFK79402.1 protein of unknown function [Azotobacter beijerinckii]
MMTMSDGWQLVCGDLAAEAVRPLLGAAARIEVLHDDLAVGPLLDVDEPPCAVRAAFWDGVWPPGSPPPAFAVQLAEEAEWLAALARQAEPVTLWHGDSGVRRRRAVALCSPQQLRDCQRQARPLSAERRAELAGQWRRAVAENGGVRRWRDGVFHSEDYRLVDGMLLCLCSRDWQPLPPLLSQAMRCCSGFFATDLFLAWRLRELARQGRVGFAEAPEADFAGQRVRRLAD